MAILNYGNQFKYSGKGYIDSKMVPVNTKDELDNISKSNLSLLYAPGMKVMVLNDEPFGPCEYYLTESYEWKRVFDFNKLTLSLDKDDIGNDGKEEIHLQLMYNNEMVGEAIDLSVLLQDVEERLESLENAEDVTPTEDTNTFVENAELVTEKEGENGLFIKFVYNDGNSFYTDITEIEPKTYAQGVGILIGEDNVISVDESWFATWFEGKVDEFNERFQSIEGDIDTLEQDLGNLSQALTALAGNVTANTSSITNALQQIAANATKINEVETVANEAKSKSIENEGKINNLSAQLAAIRGVEYIKAGENISVVESEDGFVTISANVPEVDTTEIENRLDEVEETVSGHTQDIASLRQAIENIAPEGEALAGDGKTIITNEGMLSVQVSSDELNVLKANANGLFAQGIEIVLGDEEINEEENNN